MRIHGPFDENLVCPRFAAELDAIVGSCAVLLGQPEQATVILGEALEALSASSVSWRAAVQADLAAAYAQSAEVELACDTLVASLRVAMAVGATYHIRRIRGIRTAHLCRWDDLPVVRQLDEQLHLVS
jgi:hypothetical protein